MEDKRIVDKKKGEKRGSIDCLEELWERKRDKMEANGEGEEEGFKKSKLIVKGEGKDIETWMNEMGDKMESMMGELREDFKKQERMMIDKIEKMRREFRVQMKEWDKEKEKMKKEIEVVRSRIEEIEKKVSQGRDRHVG